VIGGSNGVLELAPGGFASFGKVQTGFSYSHGGGTVTLKRGEKIMDVLIYPSYLPENVSFGRSVDDPQWVQTLCTPTERAANIQKPWEPSLEIQSGKVRDIGNVTINVEVTVQYGMVAAERCLIDFGDGAMSESCNPASHRYDRIGHYKLQAEMSNYCGTTVKRDITIDVLPDSNSSSSVIAITSGNEEQEMYSSEGVKYTCEPTTSTGVVVSEVLPNPAGKDTDIGEWVELENETEDMKPLCGWAVGTYDLSQKSYSLDGFAIPPLGHLFLPRSLTGLHLKNTKDAVHLYAPIVGEAVTVRRLTQEVLYERTYERKSYARADTGEFSWMDFPTPGSRNDDLMSQKLTAIVSKKIALLELESGGLKSKSSGSKKNRASSARSSKSSKAKRIASTSRHGRSSSRNSVGDPLLSSLVPLEDSSLWPSLPTLTPVEMGEVGLATLASIGALYYYFRKVLKTRKNVL
jgi:hypothetical protein